MKLAKWHIGKIDYCYDTHSFEVDKLLLLISEGIYDKKFNYFSFSVIYLSIEHVRDILQTLYAEKLLFLKYLMYNETLDTGLFYIQQPAKGGKHLWKSAFYLPKNTTNEEKIIMFSNAHDGGITLVNRIVVEAKSSHITFSLSDTDEGKNSMIYRDYERRERVVMALRENHGKWIFFEKGNMSRR